MEGTTIHIDIDVTYCPRLRAEAILKEQDTTITAALSYCKQYNNTHDLKRCLENWLSTLTKKMPTPKLNMEYEVAGYRFNAELVNQMILDGLRIIRRIAVVVETCIPPLLAPTLLGGEEPDEDARIYIEEAINSLGEALGEAVNRALIALAAIMGRCSDCKDNLRYFRLFD